MQISKREFEHEMTWGEFMCRYAGWARNQQDSWNIARHIMWAGVAPYSKRRRIKPSDLMKLPLIDPKPEKIDKETYEKLKR